MAIVPVYDLCADLNHMAVVALASRLQSPSFTLNFTLNLLDTIFPRD
jgi:hypothetical protein